MEQRSSFGVAFCIRRTRLNKHGEAAIQLRITINRMQADTTAKKTINPALWHTGRGRAMEKNPLAKEINMYLDAVRARITRIHRDMELDGTEFITPQMVLDRYLGKDKSERHTILGVFREHNEKCRALLGIDMSASTVERYETCLKHTQEFIQHTFFIV